MPSTGLEPVLNGLRFCCYPDCQYSVFKDRSLRAHTCPVRLERRRVVVRAHVEPSSGVVPEPAPYESAALLLSYEGKRRPRPRWGHLPHLFVVRLMLVLCVSSMLVAENERGREPLGARPLEVPRWGAFSRAGRSPILAVGRATGLRHEAEMPLRAQAGRGDRAFARRFATELLPHGHHGKHRLVQLEVRAVAFEVKVFLPTQIGIRFFRTNRISNLFCGLAAITHFQSP